MSNQTKGSNVDMRLVGRELEIRQIKACLQARRNVLMEGPVGVGKTHLALSVTKGLGVPVFRVDGDSRYSEQKLSGWFDPPAVIKKGYVADTFMPGPLVEAMQQGGVLFINELNRLPEGVQNVLLPAIDEGLIVIPRLGEVRAKEGFLVIATQNPKEFVATSHLSEAILDRFELVVLDYQGEEEETQIVAGHLKGEGHLVSASVKLVRLTRGHPSVRRGASIRAAISIAEIADQMILQGDIPEEAFLSAALLALPTRIEIERDSDSDQSVREETESLIREWVQAVQEVLKNPLKKKS